jgi:hypothetical protein
MLFRLSKLYHQRRWLLLLLLHLTKIGGVFCVSSRSEKLDIVNLEPDKFTASPRRWWSLIDRLHRPRRPFRQLKVKSSANSLRSTSLCEELATKRAFEMAKRHEGQRHKSLKTLRLRRDTSTSTRNTHFFSPPTRVFSCYFEFLFFYYYNESQKERKHRKVGHSLVWFILCFHNSLMTEWVTCSTLSLAECAYLYDLIVSRSLAGLMKISALCVLDCAAHSCAPESDIAQPIKHVVSPPLVTQIFCLRNYSIYS